MAAEKQQKQKRKIYVVPEISLKDSVADIGKKILLNSPWEKLYPEVKDDLAEISALLEEQEEVGCDYLPVKTELFSPFQGVAPEKVRIVILANRPSTEEVLCEGKYQSRAHGLALSCRPGSDTSSEVEALHEELAENVRGFVAPEHGSLEKWQKAGIFLLNMSFTVDRQSKQSHGELWFGFIEKTIKFLVAHNRHLLVWQMSPDAGKIKEVLASIVTLSSTSPGVTNKGNRGAVSFAGSQNFKKIDAYFRKFKLPPIDWSL